jgi:hypothetical protein
MRTIGFVVAASLLTSNLTLRRRLPPKNSKGGLLNLKAFKNPAYTVYCLAQFAAFLGVYTGISLLTALPIMKLTLL